MARRRPRYSVPGAIEMQVQFNVYKVVAEGKSEGGLRLQMWEFGTHHRFIGFLRDPRAVVYLHQELGRIIQEQKWGNLVPAAEATDPLPPAPPPREGD